MTDVCCGETHFHLRHKHFQEALVAVQDATEDTDVCRATTLEEALEAWDCYPEIDQQTGDITDISVGPEPWCADQEWHLLFEALGPYVTAGSSIEMENDFGHYRYFFDGLQCHTQGAIITYEELPIYTAQTHPDGP